MRLGDALTGGDPAEALAKELPGVSTHAITVRGRDAADLAAATRAVSVGFVGEAVSD